YAYYGYNITQQDLDFTAASDSVWKNRTSCGETYAVKCIGATNKMEQPCLKGKAFTKISDLKARRIRVQYNV
ncbi:hypothetical protein Prudu_000480, partial [Prunus dulcis]